MGAPVVVKPQMLLITGCSGFVGRALARHCVAQGWPVRGTVRSAAAIPRLPAGVEPVVIPDIDAATDWSRALERVRAVVHLAACVHRLPGTGRDSRGDYFRVNTAGTARLARAAADAGSRRLIFLSTVKVNGEGGEKPYTEHDGENPQGPYARSKCEAEHILREISARTGLESVVIRPPLVYGPGVGANFLRLIRLVERRIPLPLAAVRNRRSLIYVGNLVHAVASCLDAAAAAGKTYLAADAENPSTPQLIARIADLLGVAPRLFGFPPAWLRLAGSLSGRQAELDRLVGTLVVDTGRLRRDVGWRPVFSQAEGLRATIDWYRGSAGT